ncbi:hypothetical protein ACFQ3J_00430 [Paenibacillus provencensis]|uniref:Spo0E like sporulation regulatory protein n=1 Tax=Paenibacillus provencensis TaxID=441151 RepID=A0ABW3PNC2_9BACL|nr:hypothetical protein [Paenibacillus sp. MER 78]MCM3130940.1 hypothetical protein [Paenibacillus sp. MER 78]
MMDYEKLLSEVQVKRINQVLSGTKKKPTYTDLCTLLTKKIQEFQECVNNEK